jgi:hypothetical protein
VYCWPQHAHRVCVPAHRVRLQRLVSEDYAPFDVDVTTENPATTVPASAPQNYITACIGGSSSDCGLRARVCVCVCDRRLLRCVLQVPSWCHAAAVISAV